MQKKYYATNNNNPYR